MSAGRKSPIYSLPNSLVGAVTLTACFFLSGTALAHLIFREGTADLMGFDQLINVDSEANLPTWFASAVLQLTALVAWMIGDRQTRDRLHWRGIAALLFLMGIDEIASLHNMPSNRLREWTGIENGLMMNAWVIPASAVCLAVGIAFLRFIARQELWVSSGLIAAAALYVTGAIVLESVGSTIEYEAGGLTYDGSIHYSLAFELTAVAEEVFEYAGVILTLTVLLRFARQLNTEFHLIATCGEDASLDSSPMTHTSGRYGNELDQGPPEDLSWQQHNSPLARLPR